MHELWENYHLVMTWSLFLYVIYFWFLGLYCFFASKVSCFCYEFVYLLLDLVTYTSNSLYLKLYLTRFCRNFRSNRSHKNSTENATNPPPPLPYMQYHVTTRTLTLVQSKGVRAKPDDLSLILTAYLVEREQVLQVVWTSTWMLWHILSPLTHK